VNIRVASGNITEQEVGAIVVNLFAGVKAPGGATGAVDRALDGGISKLIEDGEITGKLGETTLIHTLGKMTPARVLVTGLGGQDSFTLDTVRKITAESCRRLRRVGVETVASIAHGAGIGGLETAAVGQAIAEGAILGLYRFDKYKSSDKDRKDLSELTIIESDATKTKGLGQGVAEGTVIAEAVNLCRDMVSEPANFMTPTRMAETALEVAREGGMELEVFDRPDMAERSMGALLGVAQGSDEPPKFIIMSYRGDPDDDANNLGLLGKGITFDSGGISIKPASNMGAMKGDMAGGASVISAMKAIGKLKPKINVTAIVAATENMPGGRAQRPGDIVRATNGKTIEIDNTDAEGRLVLADAAAYANSIGLSRIVDVATLTGAISVALGKVCTGAFGNDQELTDHVAAAGDGVGERIWELPTYDEYKEQYKSDVADIKNTGGRGAGSITGAMIIGEFVGDSSWVHLDIAATSTSEKVKGYNPKGATGVPVRTLVALAQRLAKDKTPSV
jgi:leucyl aminopeptidase